MKLSNLYFWKRTNKKWYRNVYTTINELPVYNWWQINDTGDLTYLLKRQCKVSDYKLNDIWINIQNQHLKAFGINESLRKILELRTEIALLESQAIINNDRSQNLFINLKKIELNKLLQQKGSDVFNTSIGVERLLNLNYHIDIFKTSVYEFYKFLEIALQQKSN